MLKTVQKSNKQTLYNLSICWIGNPPLVMAVRINQALMLWCVFFMCDKMSTVLLKNKVEAKEEAVVNKNCYCFR